MIKENNSYTFKGIHAKHIIDLVSNKEEIGIFNRNIDVLILAPIIGKLYNKKGVEESGVAEVRVINYEQIAKEKDKIDFTYRLVMMNEPYYNVETNIEKAFKDENDEKKMNENMKKFKEYMLGGIEVLHEKLIGKKISKEDIITNIYEFTQEIYEMSSKLYENKDESSIADTVEECIKNSF